MASQEVEVHFKPVIDGPVIRPGDTLVVRVDLSRRWTQEQADRVKAELKERLPGVDVLIVAADQLVIYRPEPEADRD